MTSSGFELSKTLLYKAIYFERFLTQNTHVYRPHPTGSISIEYGAKYYLIMYHKSIKDCDSDWFAFAVFIYTAFLAACQLDGIIVTL
jgi:hypothetical protein